MLFRSICTYLCDLDGSGNLLARAGTHLRAQHDQWSSFVLTELDAYLWSNFKHTTLYPEDERVAAVIQPNNGEIAKALAVLNSTLDVADYLVDERFTVTDIVAAWSVNWARRMGYLEPYNALQAYLQRLFERPACALNPE